MADKIDFSVIKLDSAAIAAFFNFLTAWIETTPPEQHARNHKRADRIMTMIEEKVLQLPPIED